MNQILYMGDKKKSKGGQMEIPAVGRLFAILIIIFGIIIAVQGALSIFSGNDVIEEQSSIPSLLIEQNSTIVTLKIKHDKVIDKVIYSWNGGEETVLQGKGRNIVEENITATVGENLLNIRIIDIFGKEATYDKELNIQFADVIPPQIEVSEEKDQKVKISVKDETALDYIIYYWNDEDETIVKAREEVPKIIEEKIEVLKGENTLNIVAVDKAGNRTEKSERCKGSIRPTVQITKDGNTAKVTVTHEQNIQKIEFNINGTLYSTDASNTGVSLGVKEYTYNFPLESGKNTINVKAYNADNVYQESTQEITL